MAVKNLFGNIKLGKVPGTLDFGLSEKLVKKVTQPKGQVLGAQTSSSFTAPKPGSFSQSGNVGNVAQFTKVQPQPKVDLSGGGGSMFSSGGSSGGGADFNSLLADMQRNGVLEKAQGNRMKDKDFDAIIAPGLRALDMSANYLNQQLPTTMADLDAQRQVAGNTLLSGQRTQEEALARQRTGATQQTEGAIAEQRRGLSEIQKGLQAQFGGGTGTGGFAAELAGRSVLSNIGNLRNGLNNTLAQIDDAGNSLKRDVQDKLMGLDQQLNQAKNEARSWLQEQINNINMKKGELEMNKAQMKMEAMRQYQTLQAEIEARNQGFVQQLYASYQDKFGQLSKAKDLESDRFAKTITELIAANQKNGAGVGQPDYNPEEGANGTVFRTQGQGKQNTTLESVFEDDYPSYLEDRYQ